MRGCRSSEIFLAAETGQCKMNALRGSVPWIVAERSLHGSRSFKSAKCKMHGAGRTLSITKPLSFCTTFNHALGLGTRTKSLAFWSAPVFWSFRRFCRGRSAPAIPSKSSRGLEDWSTPKAGAQSDVLATSGPEARMRDDLSPRTRSSARRGKSAFKASSTRSPRDSE